MIETIGQGPLEDVFEVSISKRCGWFGVPAEAYLPPPRAPKVKSELEVPAKSLVNQKPSRQLDRGVAAGHGTAAAERYDQARDPQPEGSVRHRRRLETSSMRCG